MLSSLSMWQHKVWKTYSLNSLRPLYRAKDGLILIDSRLTEKEFLTALSDGSSVILSMYVFQISYAALSFMVWFAYVRCRKVVCIEYAEPRFLDLMKKLKIPVYLQVWRENSTGGAPAMERLVARQIASSSSSGDLPWISVEGIIPQDQFTAYKF